MSDLIYFIDDEPGLAELMSEAISVKLNRPCEGFECYKSALEKVEADKPSILVVDYNLPGITGFEFIESLKSKIEDFSVIFISGEIREELFEGVKFLKKPFSVKDLIKVIET